MIPSTDQLRNVVISFGSFTVHAFTFSEAACAARIRSDVTKARFGCSAQSSSARALASSAARSGESAKRNARRTAGAALFAPSSADHQKLETYTSARPREASRAATVDPV